MDQQNRESQLNIDRGSMAIPGDLAGVENELSEA